MAIGLMISGKSPAELEEQEDQAKNHRLTLATINMVSLAALGGFLFGYDTGIVSGAMVFIRDDFGLDDIWQEVIISVTILGAWIFSMIAGSVSQSFGRRLTVLMSSVVFTVGSLVMGLAPDVWVLLVGRFTVGAGIGLSSMIIPLYIAELAPTRIRGTLVTLNCLFIVGGQAVAALVAVGLSFTPENLGWRFMLGIGALPSAIQFIGFLFLPESPRWLIQKGREQEAFKVLQRMRGDGACIDKEFARMMKNCKEPAASVEPEGEKGSNNPPVVLRQPSTSSSQEAVGTYEGGQPEGSTWNILGRVMKDRYLRRALGTGCMLMAIQQLTGINTVMYYSATIIQMSGVADKTTAVWMASITAIVNFLTTFFAFCAVDRLGRRKLVLFSLAGVICSLGLLSAGFTIETMYAPAVGSVSNDTVDASCSLLRDCESCISSSRCGFCFDPADDGNGACLASHPDQPITSSAAGHCATASRISFSEKKQADIRYKWSYGFCPAPYSFLVLLGLCLYLLAFGPGMGAMPWTINSEIYPLWARTTCLSVSTSVNWFFNMLVSLTFLTLVRAITKEGTFLLYLGFGVIGFLFFCKFLPETKGRNLEETHAMFRRSAVYTLPDTRSHQTLEQRISASLSGVANPQLVRTESGR